MKNNKNFLTTQKILLLLLIIIGAVLFSLNFKNIKQLYSKNESAPAKSLISTDKDTLTINLAEVPHIPWEYEDAPVHVSETFSAAVHGSLTPIFDMSYHKFTSQTTLFSEYYCEKITCVAKIKQGVYFHNKREVNAYDVEFSLVRQILAKDDATYSHKILNNILGIDEAKQKKPIMQTIDGNSYPTQTVEGIQVKDKYNIVFKLKEPSPFFFARISDGKVPVVPIEGLENDYVTWKKYPIGFGKYQVINADFKKSEFYLQKFDDKEKIPKFVTLLFSSDDIGDIKMLLGGPGRGISEYDNKVVFPSVYSNAGLLYNYQTELGKNENFRKAISLALDRNKIAEKALFNEMIPEDQMFTQTSWLKKYRADIPIQSQNIEEAKKLLNLVPENLWKDKVFQVPTYWEDVSDINSLGYIKEIQQQLKEIGIETEFLNTDTNYDKFADNDKNVFFFTGFGYPHEDPHRNFGHFSEGSFFKHEHPVDPVYEKLFSLSLKHAAENPEYTKQLSQYFTEKNIMTIIMFQRMVLSYDSRRVLSLGNQTNGIRLAIWEIQMRDHLLNI
jgi:ABC-type transport system substrate-binding protein